LLYPLIKQTEYIKSKIPPGRRSLWPLWAGGRIPNSKIYSWFIIDMKFYPLRDVFMTIAISASGRVLNRGIQGKMSNERNWNVEFIEVGMRK
jgi:hypothetical protein